MSMRKVKRQCKSILTRCEHVKMGIEADIRYALTQFEATSARKAFP